MQFVWDILACLLSYIMVIGVKRRIKFSRLNQISLIASMKTWHSTVNILILPRPVWIFFISGLRRLWLGLFSSIKRTFWPRRNIKFTQKKNFLVSIIAATDICTGLKIYQWIANQLPSRTNLSYYFTNFIRDKFVRLEYFLQFSQEVVSLQLKSKILDEI